jgi:cytochrome o ubiquinol oxidase subunit 1
MTDEPDYRPIEMPRNSATGFITALFATITGFALIWHIWWMAILGLLAAVITAMAFGWSDEREREIPAAEIAKLERARLDRRQPA